MEFSVKRKITRCETIQNSGSFTSKLLLKRFKTPAVFVVKHLLNVETMILECFYVVVLRTKRISFSASSKFVFGIKRIIHVTN